MNPATEPAATASTPAAPVPRVPRWAAWVLATLVCLLVFGLYTVPDFMVMLADQMWACF